VLNENTSTLLREVSGFLIEAVALPGIRGVYPKVSGLSRKQTKTVNIRREATQRVMTAQNSLNWLTK